MSTPYRTNEAHIQEGADPLLLEIKVLRHRTVSEACVTFLLLFCVACVIAVTGGARVIPFIAGYLIGSPAFLCMTYWKYRRAVREMVNERLNKHEFIQSDCEYNPWHCQVCSKSKGLH